MTVIDISGLDKAAVLAALYNNSQPQGMGFLHYDPTPMSIEEAGEVLGLGDDLTQMFGTRPTLYFDYLRGRVMKINLSSDKLDTSLYDRDMGEGAAERVINSLR